MNQTPLAFEDQHGFDNQTDEPNELRYEPHQADTTSNTQEHTKPHCIPTLTQKTEDQREKSKFERILEVLLNFIQAKIDNVLFFK